MVLSILFCALSYTCLVLAEESCKWHTWFGIYTPVHELLWLLLYGVNTRFFPLHKNYASVGQVLK